MADERARLLVAQAPIFQDGRLLLFVPIRVLACEWRAPKPVVSLCVKTSASFAAALADGAPERAPAYWCDPPAWDGRCDLVPARQACDVHVIGSAEIPPRPSGYGQGLRPAHVKVGEKTVFHFFVDARKPGRVLLTPGSVCDATATPGVELGPRAVPHPGLSLPDAFDFASCQAAPPERRIGFDEIADPIVLSGLLPQDDALTIDMPAIVPRILIDPASEHAEAEEVLLVLDGLTIDLDRQAIDMTWRGVVEMRLAEIDRVIVGFGPDVPGSPEERWYDPLRELPRGKFFYAWTLDDATTGREPPPLEEGRLEMAQLEAWDFPVGPTPQISLETYARVTTELLEARAPRAQTLAKYGLDEPGFAIEERAWGDVFARLPEGEDSQLAEFGRIVAKLQDELARPEEAQRTPKQYAELLAKIERGDPAKALAEANMTQPEWMRLDRRMEQRMTAEPALADEIERELAAARKALPPEEDRLPPEIEEAMR